MLSWSFLTLLAVAPPTGFTVSVERLQVLGPAAGASVKVDPLMATVVLKGATLGGQASRLCPQMEKHGDTVTLHCQTRRLWAEITADGKGRALDLRELTGVSWLDLELLPVHAVALRSLLLPDTCPGTLAAARGECALERGELDVARAAWTECLSTPDQGICHLRLGDLAVRDGKVEEALQHYAKVSGVGPVGKLARVRTCELVGACLTEQDSARMADTASLALDLAREVRLLSVRRELAAGRDGRALQQLLTAMEKDPDACLGLMPFCQKLVWVGLQSSDSDARMAALSAYLSDKTRRGPAEYDLNVAASGAARDLGAPAFAASILSANTPRVPTADLPSHLLEIINLYLAARDPVRAAVVLEYAEGRVGPQTRGAPWAKARRQLGRRPAPAAATSLLTSREALEALSSDVTLTTDLARATALRSKAAQPVPQSVPENAP